MTLNISQAYLTELFDYAEGQLIRKKKTSVKHTIGEVVGGPQGSGYIRTQINGVRYMLHRLIWNLHNGDIPSGYEVDHINGKRDDNRLCNLRICRQLDNAKNRFKTKVHCSSPYKGVHWDSRKQQWIAQGALLGVRLYLGQYETEIAAALAYNKFALEWYGTYAKLNVVTILINQRVEL